MPESVRLVAKVIGEVQGVSFRYYTFQQARTLGLSGYVRNLADGTVEVVAEGEPGAVENLLSWLRIGPPSAHVERVQFQWEQARGGLRGFEVRF